MHAARNHPPGPLQRDSDAQTNIREAFPYRENWDGEPLIERDGRPWPPVSKPRAGGGGARGSPRIPDRAGAVHHYRATFSFAPCPSLPSFLPSFARWPFLLDLPLNRKARGVFERMAVDSIRCGARGTSQRGSWEKGARRSNLNEGGRGRCVLEMRAQLAFASCYTFDLAPSSLIDFGVLQKTTFTYSADGLPNGVLAVATYNLDKTVSGSDIAIDVCALQCPSECMSKEGHRMHLFVHELLHHISTYEMILEYRSPTRCSTVVQAISIA